MYENYLAHYGVLGMRWGHRSGSARSVAKANYKKDVKKANATFQKGAKDYENETKRLVSNAKTRSEKRSIRKTRDKDIWSSKNKNFIDKYDNDLYSAVTKYNNAKAKIKSNEKMQKVKAKELRTKYEKEYLSGKSSAGKTISKIMGTHKTYGKLMAEFEQKGVKD